MGRGTTRVPPVVIATGRTDGVPEKSSSHTWVGVRVLLILFFFFSSSSPSLSPSFPPSHLAHRGRRLPLSSKDGWGLLAASQSPSFYDTEKVPFRILFLLGQPTTGTTFGSCCWQCIWREMETLGQEESVWPTARSMVTTDWLVSRRCLATPGKVRKDACLE